MKTVNEITARQTRTSLCKLDVDFTYKIIEYLTLGLLSSLWNICHISTAYFFDRPYRLAAVLSTARRKLY